MTQHPLLFLKENKLWIAKGILILFAFISVVVYFADFYHTVYTRFQSCHEIHPLLVCLGVLCAIFTACSLVIFLVQYHKYRRGKEYIHLDLDEDGDTNVNPLDNNMMSSRTRNVLKWCSHTCTLSLSIVLVVVMIAYASVSAKTLPKLNGKLVLHGLISDATIQREPDGVLHVKANNLHDLYFVQGVAMAQERLWEMEFYRRVGSGTLSAVLGNATLEIDSLFRTMGIRDASQASLGALSNNSLMIVNSFVEGINNYLQDKPPLPIEFHLLGFKPEPYTPVDAVLMVKILAFELAGNYFKEILYHKWMHVQNLTFARICELFPDYPPNVPTILDDEDIKHINFTHQFEPITYTRTILHKNEQTKKSSDPKSWQKRSNLPKIEVEDLGRHSGVLRGLNLGFKSASNNWVISGNRTQSGKPLLCNDPHLTISAPSIWLLMHLESPEVNVIGATPVGAPGITIGRNADIAWGVTNTFIDVQDMYILETSQDGSSYFSNDTWSDFEIRTEVIQIKDAADVTLHVRESKYGPVMSDIVDFQGQTAALRWTQLDDNDTTFDAIAQLSQAKNWDDFRNALRSYVGPAQNFIYADTTGNIGYQCPGKVPVRAPGHSGMIPVPGNGSYDWIGWIPYDELPYVLNPSKGYIVSANNKIVPPSYPYLLLNNHDWEEHFRALSITQLVNSTKHHTVKTMMDIQSNTVTGTWVAFKPFLSALPDAMLDDKAHTWKYKLLEWNGDENVESQQATVFEYWMYYLGRLGAAETGYYSWGVPYFLLDTLANATSPACQGSCLHYAASSFVQAVHSAKDKKWGEKHHLFIEHAVMSNSPVACLFDREVKTGGNSFTINLGAIDPSDPETKRNPFNSYAGPSYRQIVDLSNMDNSQFVIPMGNSGNLLDDNYDNMLHSFLAGEYYPMKMDKYEVAKTLKLS